MIGWLDLGHQVSTDVCAASNLLLKLWNTFLVHGTLQGLFRITLMQLLVFQAQPNPLELIL